MASKLSSNSNFQRQARIFQIIHNRRMARWCHDIEASRSNVNRNNNDNIQMRIRSGQVESGHTL